MAVSGEVCGYREVLVPRLLSRLHTVTPGATDLGQLMPAKPMGVSVSRALVHTHVHSRMVTGPDKDRAVVPGLRRNNLSSSSTEA